MQNALGTGRVSDERIDGGDHDRRPTRRARTWSSTAAVAVAVAAVGVLVARNSSAEPAAPPTQPAAAVVAATSPAREQPRFRAVGLLRVEVPSEIPDGTSRVAGRSAGADEVAMAAATRARVLAHEATLVTALADPAAGPAIKATGWYRGFASDAERSRDLFENGAFRAAAVPGTRLIQVELTAADAAEARMLLQQLVGVHVARARADFEAREQKRLKLLKDEMSAAEFYLSQVIRPQRIDMEKGLGLGGVEINGTWNAPRTQFDRLLQERTKVRAELAGLNVQKESLESALRDGKTPAEVQSMVTRDERFLQGRQRLDDLEIQIEQLVLANGEKHESVARARKQRASAQEKLDGTREELRSGYAETMRSTLSNQIAALSANTKAIESDLFQLNQQLSDLNQMQRKYHMLQGKERTLSDQVDAYERTIREFAAFRLGLKWTPLQWEVEPPTPLAPAPAAR